MLLNWNESKQGRTAVFLLDEESDSHPFKKFTTKKGKRAGQRFMAVLVELNDDDTPVVQEKKGGPLSKSAAQLCENENFQKFARETHPHEWSQIPNGAHAADAAAIILRQRCGITSRAELDHDAVGAANFRQLMREYREWNK